MTITDTVVVICSRPESKRLPGKCFRKLGGLTAIGHILHRLNRSVSIPIILAVPHGKRSDYQVYEQFDGVTVFEGNVESPLHRMAQALEWYGRANTMPKYVVRITHDDILIDGGTLQWALHKAREENAGYVITPSIIEGAGVEIIHVANVMRASYHNKGQIEHISYFVRGEGTPNPKVLHLEPRATIARPYRLTLDYPEDAVVLEAVFRQVGPLATNDEICQFLDENPHYLRYNRLPEVSVYTCAYNADRWLTVAVNSVLASDRKVEYVLVEDASLDNTLNQALNMSLVDGYEKFKLIVNETNLGLASSSNIALSNCRGRYVMRVDADDRVKPEAISRMVAKLKESKAAMVYANFDEIDENGMVTTENVDAKIKHHAGCALMDSKLINEVKFRDGIRHWDSLDLYERVKERFPIAYIEEPLWYYRVRPDSMSHADSAERRIALDQMINTNGSHE